jgi:hypothetical protein
MPYRPPWPTLPVIFHPSKYGQRINTPSSSTPSAANVLYAYPFVIELATMLYKAFWLNGSAAGGNHEVAVYNERFEKIATTGSQAGATNSAPEIIDWTDVLLAPGLYYAAYAHDSTTANRVVNVMTRAVALGCWQQSSITLGSLPATATPEKYGANNVAGAWGFITRSNFDI